MTNLLWTDEYLESKRLVMDPPADEAVAAIYDKYRDLDKVDELLFKLTRNDQLDPSQFPPELARFFEATSKLPEWADPAKILAGEELFKRWGMEALVVLLCASLPECYTMRNEVQVLAATQRLQAHTDRRIRQTAQMVIDVMQPGGLTSKGSGVVMAQRVRLMHGAIRHLILHDGGAPNGPPRSMGEALRQFQWHDLWGKPICQEDLAFTLLTFSFVILRGLGSLGIRVSDEEKTAFIHCWNVVGHIMGVERELMGWTYEECQELFDKIKARQAGPTDAGKGLTAALQTFIVYALELMKLPPPVAKALSSHVEHMLIRFFVEDWTADILGVKKAEWYEKGVMDAITAALDLVHRAEAASPALAALAVWFGTMYVRAMTALQRDDALTMFRLPEELQTAWGVTTS